MAIEPRSFVSVCIELSSETYYDVCKLFKLKTGLSAVIGDVIFTPRFAIASMMMLFEIAG
jgi:hypothetical protein